ncbi:hypothetical protein BH23GEM10_BH23GEM10_12600 [soil metagenome]
MAEDERQTRRTVLGALLIAALVGTAVLVFSLDRLIERFRSTYHLVAVVPAAPGIAAGSPVWIGGKEVGTVSELAFMTRGPDASARIALTLRLPTGLQPQVRADSRVRFASARMIGTRSVDILPGSPDQPALAPGDTLFPVALPTAAELTARAAGVRASFDTVLVDIRELEPAARIALARTRNAFAGMELAMAEARLLQADIQSSPGLALLGSAEFNTSLERARSHAAELPAMLDQLQQRAGPMGDVGAAFARLRLRADSLSNRLAAFSEMIDYPNGSAARFRQDTALVKALNATRMELDSLLADVRRNPLRFVYD